jgi:hypothetical protein
VARRLSLVGVIVAHHRATISFFANSCVSPRKVLQLAYVTWIRTAWSMSAISIEWCLSGSIACSQGAGCAEDSPARNRYPLAQRWFPSILALEITTAPRPAKGSRRNSTAHSRDEHRQPSMGSATDRMILCYKTHTAQYNGLCTEEYRYFLNFMHHHLFWRKTSYGHRYLHGATIEASEQLATYISTRRIYEDSWPLSR